MDNNNAEWDSYQCLHPSLITSLLKNNLNHPSPVQQQVFSAYSFHHDFLIAAQTGSGKTLAFAAPILSQLYNLKNSLQMVSLPNAILALVLTPTRQLAQQIHANMNMALQQMNKANPIQSQIRIATIIGGISRQKQLRILSQKKPHLIIGTPGRLHELLGQDFMSFQHLKYLVVDQADRMIQMGHFKQVDEILQKVFTPKKQVFFDKDFHKISKQLDKKSVKDDFFIRQGKKKVKLQFSLASIPTDQLFEIPQGMLQFTGQGVEQQKPKKSKKQIKIKETQPKIEIELTQQQQLFLRKLKRRIFFVSATLTREFKGTKYAFKKARTEQQWKEKKERQKQQRKQKQKKQLNSKKGSDNDKKQEQGVQQTIPKLKALISRAKFSQKPKIIDLSSLLFLPETLTQKICFSQGQIQKTTMLICYLSQLPTNSKTIIFSNTIKTCKRIQFFCDSFGFQSVNLHSHMQQKQRLKKIQKFKKSSLCNILIATDVAARGLDFKISHVIQVGVAINGDTYVHRAGRTARANRTGQALVIVDRKQVNRWTQINDTITESMPKRTLEKFVPTSINFQQMREKVEKFQWVRRNTERQIDVRAKQMDQEDADYLGVQVQQQAPRRKYNMDKQQQQQVRAQVRKQKQQIQRKDTTEQHNNGQWRKNRMVLSLEEIKRML